VTARTLCRPSAGGRQADGSRVGQLTYRHPEVSHAAGHDRILIPPWRAGRPAAKPGRPRRPDLSELTPAGTEKITTNGISRTRQHRDALAGYARQHPHDCPPARRARTAPAPTASAWACARWWARTRSGGLPRSVHGLACRPGTLAAHRVRQRTAPRPEPATRASRARLALRHLPDRGPPGPLTQHHLGEHRIAWPALRKAGVSDGASSDELAALRQTVPAPVVSIIGRVFGGKYRRTIAPAWKERAS
jgi:hypothetical protein